MSITTWKSENLLFVPKSSLRWFFWHNARSIKAVTHWYSTAQTPRAASLGCKSSRRTNGCVFGRPNVRYGHSLAFSKFVFNEITLLLFMTSDGKLFHTLTTRWEKSLCLVIMSYLQKSWCDLYHHAFMDMDGVGAERSPSSNPCMILNVWIPHIPSKIVLE